MSDTYGEDIGGQSYGSYTNTPGDGGGLTGSDGDTPEEQILGRTTGSRTINPPGEGGLSDYFNTIGGGIRNIGNYYKNNSRGILGSMLGSMFMGPLGMILGGYAGRNFDSIKDRFSPDYDPDKDEDTELRNKLLSTQFGVMPKPKPEGILGIRKNLPDISNLQAKLNVVEQRAYDNLKGIVDAVGPGMLNDNQKQQLEQLEQKKNESNLGLGNFIV